MKIVGIETVRVATAPSLIFLQVHTDEGLVGLGETCLGVEAVEAQIHEHVAPVVLGGDPHRVAGFARTLYDDFVGFGDAGVATRARSALDIALLDIVGQAAGIPLYQLFGGPTRESIRVYNSCAGPGYGSTDANVDRAANVPTRHSGGRYEDLESVMFRPAELAEELLSEGITAMKLWPFDAAAVRGGGWDITPAEMRAAIAPLVAIRDAVGDRIDLMVDLHGVWHLPAATAIMHELEQFDLFWIEDPVKADDFDTIATLGTQRRSATPIAMGETLATTQSFHRLLSTGAVDVVMFDVGWVGGVSEAAKVAALADSRSRPFAPHDCTGPVVLTSGIHLAVSAPNALIQESVRAFYRGWYADLVTELPVIERGFASPPRGPGLGTAMNPDLLARDDVTRRLSGRSTLG